MAKIIYYISIFICSLIFILYIVGPFGGPLAILGSVKNGFYNEEYIATGFDTSITEAFIVLNKIVGLVFWICITLPLILAFVRTMDKQKKIYITLCCIGILIMIVFVPKIYAWLI